MTTALDDRADWLEQYIALHEGLPSHATIVCTAKDRLAQLDRERAAAADRSIYRWPATMYQALFNAAGEAK